MLERLEPQFKQISLRLHPFNRETRGFSRAWGQLTAGPIQSQNIHTRFREDQDVLLHST